MAKGGQTGVSRSYVLVATAARISAHLRCCVASTGPQWSDQRLAIKDSRFDLRAEESW